MAKGNYNKYRRKYMFHYNEFIRALFLVDIKTDKTFCSIPTISVNFLSNG